MLVPNRHKAVDDGYRYGFQGQEKDDEIKGEGNSYDYGDRMYDPRIGRWFKIDIQASQMPQVSPYAFALNNPVYLIDEDGEIPIIPFLLKATASAAADALLQASLIYLTDDSVTDFGSAFKKIDKSDVAWSFIEGLNPFKVPGGKFGKAAAVGTADLMIYIAEQTLDGEEISSADLGREFMVGFISELAGDQASKLLSNKQVRRKLEKLLGLDQLQALQSKVFKKNVKKNLPGVDVSRINLAKGRTRFTPMRGSTGQPVSAGWDHILDGHFGKPLSGTRSIFSISPEKLKTILQSKTVINSPVTALGGGQYKRTVNVGTVVGNANLKQGGGETSWINVITDKKGNIITAYPVAKPSKP